MISEQNYKAKFPPFPSQNKSNQSTKTPNGNILTSQTTAEANLFGLVVVMCRCRPRDPSGTCSHAGGRHPVVLVLASVAAATAATPVLGVVLQREVLHTSSTATWRGSWWWRWTPVLSLLAFLPLLLPSPIGRTTRRGWTTAPKFSHDWNSSYFWWVESRPQESPKANKFKTSFFLTDE